MPTKKNKPRIYKIPSKSQILSYMVKQGKLSPIKVGRENLRVCQLEVGELIGGVIFIRELAW